MNKEEKRKFLEEQKEEDRRLLFHPANVYVTILLFGLSALFLALTAAYIYTRTQNHLPPLRLPNIFLVNTVILLASSGMMWRAKQCYYNDDTDGYQQSLVATIGLSFVFMAAQYYGWHLMFSDQIFINSTNAASYLYAISGLHFLHVIGGLPFLIIFYVIARKRMREPVSVLVYFSDPEKRLRLRLLTLYWHFLDALWIYLVLFFFINYWIK